jgi:hypothetical protein
MKKAANPCELTASYNLNSRSNYSLKSINKYIAKAGLMIGNKNTLLSSITLAGGAA